MSLNSHVLPLTLGSSVDTNRAIATRLLAPLLTSVILDTGIPAELRRRLTLRDHLTQ
jgi:hypothetical protein